MTTTLEALPKVELHVHLEGTATPALIRRLAERHRAALPEQLIDADGSFRWADFHQFLQAYDAASSFIRTAEDYRDVTYDYLARCAAEGAIYVEVMSSPDHAAVAGLSYQAHLDGIAQGIADARAEFGIEARIIVTCVRHFGVERGMEVARACVRHPHPLVTGFGMGGDEALLPASAFAEVFRIAHEEAGLACTVHAGETAGPDSVRSALDYLPVQRLGHGVRAVEDPRLVRRIAEAGIPLEICPTSNIRTGVYTSFADHPLERLRDAGCIVTLNSDDPPYFNTSIGGEYRLAATVFGWTECDLKAATHSALESAFVDSETRRRLQARLPGRQPAGSGCSGAAA